MKKIILIALVLYSGVAISNKITIINSGFEFSPDTVAIKFGDTIVFQLSSIHNAVEVNHSTWIANGTTALSGGFSTPFSGGQIIGLTVGTHYYICTNHALIGMKGRIFVNADLGINLNNVIKNIVTAFPNPSEGKITLQSEIDIANPNNRITIFNDNGVLVLSNQITSKEIDLSPYSKGIYLLDIIADRKSYSLKILIE